MKIPYIQPGDGPNHPLNRDYFNQLVYYVNAFANLKVRIGNREYVPIYTENGAYINLSGNFSTGSTIIISGSFSGSISGSTIYDRSDVWQ
jgi:hypothetical protein